MALTEFGPDSPTSSLFTRRDRALLRALDDYMASSYAEGLAAGEGVGDDGMFIERQASRRYFTAMYKRQDARVGVHAVLAKRRLPTSLAVHQRLEGNADDAGKKPYKRGELEGRHRRGESPAALAALRDEA